MTGQRIAMNLEADIQSREDSFLFLFLEILFYLIILFIYFDRGGERERERERENPNQALYFSVEQDTRLYLMNGEIITRAEIKISLNS